MKNHKKLLIPLLIGIFLSLSSTIYLNYAQEATNIGLAHLGDASLFNDQATEIGFSEMVIIEWTTEALRYLITLQK